MAISASDLAKIPVCGKFILFKDGEKRIRDEAFVAITRMIVKAAPEEKRYYGQIDYEYINLIKDDNLNRFYRQQGRDMLIS